MSKDKAAFFMIMDKNTGMCLHQLENEDSGECEYLFDHVDFEARISSVFGLSDNEFNCEGQENLQAFYTEAEAQSLIDNDLKEVLSASQVATLKVVGLEILMTIVE